MVITFKFSKHMSINTRHAVNERKVQHMGDLFSTIDFEVISSPQKVTLERMNVGSTAGKLTIGTKTFDLAIAELDRIVETCEIAKRILFQKYRFRMQ